MKNTLSGIFPVLTLACAALLASVSAHAQITPAFKEDFEGRPLNTNLLDVSTQGWKRNTRADSWPKESTIVVKREGGLRFASITAQGDKTFNARIGSRDFKALDISDSANNVFSADIRWLTPGSDSKAQGRSVQTLFRDGNTVVTAFGINGKGEFFFTVGGKTETSPAAVSADPSKWYRLRVQLLPGKGEANAQVVEVANGNEGATVWSQKISGVTVGTKVNGLELQVQRPSPRPGEVRSADFDNILVGSVGG